ncbi:MAG TPA: LuxR C-terminal-related transcriptional regulator [Sporichthyaceae bacterium]|jgi:DNA-binding CsgD family transcriptional regulator
MAAKWPLLGRDGDLGRVQRVWSAGPTSVVVAGPPGVGKTVFARACLDQARSRGWHTELLMSPAATAALDATGAPMLVALLDRLTANEGTTVLLVDDANLLGEAEAALVYDAAVRRGIVVLATLRSEAPTPTAVTALWKNEVALRLELAALSEDDVSRLLTTVLDGQVERATAARFAEHSEGNALYLRELVLGARADGTLRRSHELWRLVGALRPSDRLAELVAGELHDLPAVDRRALEVVAYAGTLTHESLQQLVAAEVIDNLERTGQLISTRAGDHVEHHLRHRVHQDVLRAGLSPARSRTISRQLIDAVTATTAAQDDQLQLAEWSLDAHAGTPAELLTAARTARWRYDFALAERLVAAAILVGGGFEAELLAAQLAGLQGRNADAERQLAELAHRATTDAERGQVAVGRLDNGAIFHGEIESGLRIAEDAERTITDPRWRDHVRAAKLTLLLAGRGPRAAADAAEPLLRNAGGLVLVRACGSAAFSFVRTGAIDKALRASELGLAAHRDLDEPTDRYPWFHVLTRCMALAQAGRLLDAETEAREQHARGVAESSPERQAFFSWHLARVVGDRGHIREAIQHGREAVSRFRELGHVQYAREAQVALALALALAGRGTEAEALLHELDEFEAPAFLYTAADRDIARGWTLAAGGDLPGAVEAFRSAAALGIEIGDLTAATAALHAIARLGHPDDVLDELVEISAAVQGELAGARVAHAKAISSGDPDELNRCARLFETLGADLLAAEASADHAEALLRAGRRRDSNAARRHAEERLARCSGAATPALRRLDIHASLTRSEYEIALLAAGGATSTTIAEQLGLSSRTVQNHLQHAYDKLGVHSRAELSDALGGTAPRRPTQKLHSRI